MYLYIIHYNLYIICTYTLDTYIHEIVSTRGKQVYPVFRICNPLIDQRSDTIAYPSRT